MSAKTQCHAEAAAVPTHTRRPTQPSKQLNSINRTHCRKRCLLVNAASKWTIANASYILLASHIIHKNSMQYVIALPTSATGYDFEGHLRQELLLTGRAAAITIKSNAGLCPYPDLTGCLSHGPSTHTLCVVVVCYFVIFNARLTDH